MQRLRKKRVCGRKRETGMDEWRKKTGGRWRENGEGWM